MIGLKFINGSGEVVEAISEPYVFVEDDGINITYIIVKELLSGLIYEDSIFALKRCLLETEVEAWRNGATLHVYERKTTCQSE